MVKKCTRPFSILLKKFLRGHWPSNLKRLVLLLLLLFNVLCIMLCMHMQALYLAHDLYNCYYYCILSLEGVQHIVQA